MTLAASQVTVDDTAGGTPLHTGDSGPSGAALVVTNRDGANPVFLGATGVTIGSGYELKAGETVGLALTAGEELFAIAGAALTAAVHVIATGA